MSENDVVVPPEHDTTARLLFLARLGLAHSVFGQLYEATVDVPGRITRDPLPGVLAPTSPTRYFLPLAPITRGALFAAVATGWDRRDRRAPLATAATAVVGELGITAYLVRNVNSRLFIAGAQAPAAERPALLRRWHRLNAVRLAAASIAWGALLSARSATR